MHKTRIPGDQGNNMDFSTAREHLSTEDYVHLNAQYCAPTHTPIPIVLAEGRGAHVWDIDGNEYIDFLSAFSVANQGHCHPRIVRTMMEQCQKLPLCTSAFQNDSYPLLCKKICEVNRRPQRSSLLRQRPTVSLTWIMIIATPI